jgi:glyoxylase-like metal-dependent hydrolase (beta-lactamase superfamily II)
LKYPTCRSIALSWLSRFDEDVRLLGEREQQRGAADHRRRKLGDKVERMFRSLFLVGVSAASFMGCSSDEEAPVSQETSRATGASTLDAAEVALSVESVDSIAYTGSAWRIRNSFRQTPNASPPWLLRDDITNYRRALDLEQPASLATGETFAQNLFFAPAVAGVYLQNVPADQTAWGQQLEIWLTPWGFLRGARANAAEESSQVVDGTRYSVLTWKSPAGQLAPSGISYTVKGYIDPQNLVARVETWTEDAFMGDLQVTALYSDYAELDGVMVPRTIEQQRAGGGVFGVTVEDATVNPTNLAELLTPPPPAAATAPAMATPPVEAVEQLAEGVHLVTGGYVSLAVEFQDYVAVFEAGQSEARGQAIIDRVEAAIPAKPIRYVINSHPHSDHTAGLVPFVRRGITIVTHESNVPFLQMGLSTPRTLLGQDTLDPQFEAAGESLVLEDASMRLELRHIPNRHSDGMLVAFLPAQRVLFQADFTLPQTGAAANPFVISLAEYVRDSALDFDRYLAVHAAAVPQTKADLMTTIGL